MAAAGTSGTEPIGAILALVAALEDAVDTQKMMARTARYRELAALVWETLLPFVVVGLVLPTGATTRRAPHIVSFCVRGANRRDLVLNGFRCGPQRDLSAALEREGGVLASGGSACTSDSGLPSHVLAAMCVPPAYIHGSELPDCC